MISSKKLVDQIKEYKEVLLLMEKNLNYIEAIGVDKSHLQTYRRILNHLIAKNPVEIQSILESGLTKGKSLKKSPSQFIDKEIKKLDKDEIKTLLGTQKLTRSTLERMAVVRFGVPQGSLSVLRTRDALIQKILTLLSHEDTHEAISHAALGSEAIDPTKKD